MSGRLEIELTSQRADGMWTWRAAGARLPKGSVNDELVPESAEIGSLLRAETSASLDGLTITALSLPREQSEPKNRLELIGRGRDSKAATALVTTRYQRSDRDNRQAEWRAAGKASGKTAKTWLG